MTFQEFFKKLDAKEKLPLPKDIRQRVGASLAVQIHSSGARPAYRINGQIVEPESYQQKFDDLFKQRLLNRHPNESEDLYNWRLSNYNPLPEDIFNRFLNGAKGSILQPNNFVITSEDDKTSEYINSMDIKEVISDGLEFILNNPRGYMAVIIETDKEQGQDEPNKPCIEFVEPSEILLWDAESVAFRDDKTVYYFDKEFQISRSKAGTFIIKHGFGEIPVWDVDNKFIQSYVKFADEVAKNFSDDGMMTKQYSYPIKQVVLPQCPECMGKKQIPVQEEGTEAWIPRDCKKCNGKGVLSMNPGDTYTYSEEQLYKNNGQMPDLARFITPDIGIPKYHMERVIEYYNKCEDSLYLRKRINATESGDAKKEDRKDQYMFLSSISRFLFDNLRKALIYISAYKNYNNTSGRYEAKNVIVVAPKQLDLMTDNDLVNELLTIQGKTDDSMILGETQYAVTNKIYRDDNVQSKINDILYRVDDLYGATGIPLKNKLLSGIYSDRDKTIHEKGYKVLLNMSIDMTPAAFMEADTNALIKQFNTTIDAITPQGIYDNQAI